MLRCNCYCIAKFNIYISIVNCFFLMQLPKWNVPIFAKFISKFVSANVNGRFKITTCFVPVYRVCCLSVSVTWPASTARLSVAKQIQALTPSPPPHSLSHSLSHSLTHSLIHSYLLTCTSWDKIPVLVAFPGATPACDLSRRGLDTISGVPRQPLPFCWNRMITIGGVSMLVDSIGRRGHTHKSRTHVHTPPISKLYIDIIHYMPS
jgi:hypothetical protein